LKNRDRAAAGSKIPLATICRAGRQTNPGENRIRNANSIICESLLGTATAARVNDSGCHPSSLWRRRSDAIAGMGLAVYVSSAALRAAFSNARVSH